MCIYLLCVIYLHLHWCRDWIKYHKIKNQNHVSCFNICSMSWEELFINTALRIQPFMFFLIQIEPQPPRAQNKPIKRTPTLNVFQKVRRNRISLDISNFTIRNSVDIPQLTSPFFEPHNIRPGCKKEGGWNHFKLKTREQGVLRVPRRPEKILLRHLFNTLLEDYSQV